MITEDSGGRSYPDLARPTHFQTFPCQAMAR